MIRSARQTRSPYYRISCIGAVVARQGLAMERTASASCTRRRAPRGPALIRLPACEYHCTTCCKYTPGTRYEYTAYRKHECVLPVYTYYMMNLIKKNSLRNCTRVRKLKNEATHSRVNQRHYSTSKNRPKKNGLTHHSKQGNLPLPRALAFHSPLTTSSPYPNPPYKGFQCS